MQKELQILCEANHPEQETSPNTIWHKLESNIQVATKNALGHAARPKLKTWMTDEILDRMEDRRLAKNDKTKYKAIDKAIKTKIRKAKEIWIRGECDEAERLLDLHDSFNFHKKVKEITGYNKYSQLTSLKDNNGKLVLDGDRLREIWRSYAEGLFEDARAENDNNYQQQLSGPEILESEVIKAVNSAKNGKSPGPDNVYAEVLKCISVKQLTYLFNQIYDTGQIPEDWLKSTFVTIPKKNKSEELRGLQTYKLNESRT